MVAVEGRYRVRLWLPAAKHNLSDYFLLTEFHDGTDQLEPAKIYFWFTLIVLLYLLFMTFLSINLIGQNSSRTNLAIIKFWSVLWQEDVEYWLVALKMMDIFFIDSIIASQYQSCAEMLL